jgi:dienelactone hydrolase
VHRKATFLHDGAHLLTFFRSVWHSVYPRVPGRLLLWASSLLLISLTTLYAENAVAVDSEPASLAALINEYVKTPDGDNASALLAEILQHPLTNLATVESMLRNGRIYTTQPVGLQPSVSIAVRNHTFRYGLYVPLNYQSSKSYALVICLHGAGFTGDAYLERWQTRLNEQYILACPTLPQGNWWTREAADVVLATLHAVQSLYHVDPDRIFLTGMSNGGIGVYLIGSHYAPLFAGLAPMASGLDDVLLPFLKNLRHTPVYLIHGTQDQVMPVELSRTIAQELTRLGYPYTYREHDRTHPVAGGHYFPREELPDLIAWFDAQHRESLSKTLTVVRDATHLSPFAWVRIDSTDRIAAFSDNLVDRRDDAIKNRVYAKFDAEIVGPNRIEVRTERVRRYSLFLNQDLVDLAKPLTVVTNGQVSYEGPVTPSIVTVLREARRRHDRALLFPVVLTIAVDDHP